MVFFEVKDPRFLDLVARIVIRGPALGVRGLAKRLDVGEEEVEAAIVKLIDRGVLVYRRRKSRRRSG